MLKKFLNTSEFKSLKIIEKTLKNSKYKVFPGSVYLYMQFLVIKIMNLTEKKKGIFMNLHLIS